jgi:hypothetical protein
MLELVQLVVARGRWREGLALLDTLTPTDSVRMLAYRAQLLSLPFAPDYAADRAATRNRIARWYVSRVEYEGPTLRGLPRMTQPVLLGILAARERDFAAAARTEASLNGQPGSPILATLRAALGAAIAVHANRPGDVLASLDVMAAGPVWGSDDGADPYLSGAFARYARGAALAALGRSREAVVWLASIDGIAIADLPYLGPSLQLTAMLQRRQGDTAGEIRTLRTLTRLWRDCDPELRPALDSARARLQELAVR